jgi:histidine ammonia-lyase
MKKVKIGGESLHIDDVVDVARKYTLVEIDKGAEKRIRKSRKIVEELIRNGETVYGITTGFGSLCDRVIPKREARKVQENLIRSHTAACGDFLPTDVVRATMLLRAHTLAKGYSGIRLKTLKCLVEMLNERVHPLVPEAGSVGASGDLSQLAHIASTMTGEWKSEYKGKIYPAAKALKSAGIDKIKLSYKEGLSLINGPTVMTAMGALAVYDAKRLIKTAEIAGALSLEALGGISEAFNKKLHEIKPHKGQIESAAHIRKLVHGSELLRNKASGPGTKIQNAYSLRCMPQIMGSVRDAIDYVWRVIETELYSVSDNPLIFSKERILHGGNFHGQPVALAMDILGMALTEVGILSERRIVRLLDKNLSEGLPSYLTERGGLQSGFMCVEYTAASLVAENRTLAYPASIQSVPVNENVEDIVSMGMISARNARKILRNTEYIVGIELLCGAQAVDFRGPDKLGWGTKKAYELVRKYISRLEMDRIMYHDIEKITKLVRNGTFVQALEKAI